MPALGGSGGSALLASAGAVSFHRNFSGSLPDTWYAAALANELSGATSTAPTRRRSRSSSTPTSMARRCWDRSAGTTAPTRSREPTSTSSPSRCTSWDTASASPIWWTPSTGSWLLGDQTGIFDRMLFRPLVGPFADLLRRRALGSDRVRTALFWNGPDVVALNGGPAACTLPIRAIRDRAWRTGTRRQIPHELMVPFYTEAVHDPGLLLPALMDMGWSVTVPTPTPRASAAPPTQRRHRVPRSRRRGHTAAARSTECTSPTSTTDTVSVIDPAYQPSDRHDSGGRRSRSASRRATDGRRVYVANFQVGTVSVVSTRTNRVLATIRGGDLG